MSSGRRWRFIFSIVGGPNAGLGAGPWRIWAHRNDVYVAAAGLGNIVKASLHESGSWRVAYTSEHMATSKPLWDKTSDRAVWKFAAPPFEDRTQVAFVIAVVRAALRPVQAGARDKVIPLQDRWDVLTGVKVVVTEPDVTGPDPDSLVYPDPLELANGRRVWLSLFEDPTEAAEPEPVPVGQMIRVMTDLNVVACPGFLVVGLNIG